MRTTTGSRPSSPAGIPRRSTRAGGAPDGALPIVVSGYGDAKVLTRLFREDDGQDLVEYALLVGFVAFVGIAGWLAIQDAIAAGYTWWDTADQDLGAVTPDPD